MLDHIQLAPTWRGFGLGVVLAGLAIQRLSGGCPAAICYPASLTNETEAIDNADTIDNVDAIDKEDRVTRQARAKLSAVWSQRGFEHFRDGVHVLDLGMITLDEAVERLRERISRLG